MDILHHVGARVQVTRFRIVCWSGNHNRQRSAKSADGSQKLQAVVRLEANEDDVGTSHESADS